jgi:3-hydroxy-9,10-secoandrosta-1,3,5(10)-triene-9,17-dione monooxygenase reductase component
VDDRPVGLTCQSFFSVSLEPALVALSVNKSSTSFPAIRTAEAFSVNVLAAHQHEVSGAFGRTGADKWRGIAWDRGRYGQPLLHGAIAWFECRIQDIHPAGDHEIVVAEVLDLGCDETAEPLLFFRSEYRRLVNGALSDA